MTTQADIVGRFFSAVDALVAARRLRGTATFCRRYGINRRNLWQLQRKGGGGIFKVEWLTHLVADYGISARWLLTGEGGIFDGEGGQ